MRKRSSFSRWFEITGLPVFSAKPAGEARSAPTLASPTMPGGQPTPARISSRFSAGRCSSTLAEVGAQALGGEPGGQVEQLRERACP